MQVKESGVDQDEEVDIITVEHDSTFSDSDMSQEELCFLPAFPCPDAPEQHDKNVGSSMKLVESNHSASSLSADAAQNGQAINHESSLVEGKCYTNCWYLNYIVAFLFHGRVLIA